MSNILYKYLDINGAKCMLGNQNLQFTNASQLNDPFDCHPSLIDCSNVPEEKRKGWPANIIKELHSNRLTNNREDLWICCLSKLYDSILMWSYYNKHEGVCLGLNMEHVAKYINANYNYNHFLLSISKKSLPDFFNGLYSQIILENSQILGLFFF